MKKLLSLLFISTLLAACTSKVDEPRYKVVSQEGQIQIRHYEPTAIAYTLVEGERDEAINDGFRALFKYIDGANVAQQSIPMTAPVAQSAASKKIPMTTPVAQVQAGDGQWKVVFYMPNDAEFAELPQPTDEAVKLEAIPAQKKAVINYSGWMDDENIAENEAKLRRYLKVNNIRFHEPAHYAGYNPPWTLPFARRNEVMFRLK